MKHIILSFLLLISYFGFGQISQGGVPYSFQLYAEKTGEAKRLFLEKIPTFNMPHIQKSIIDELKANNNKRQDSYQFAYSFDTIIDVKKSAVEDSIDCGILYRLAIKSPEAYSINIIFSEYHVPPGAKLFLYNETYDYVIGAFTSNNNKDDRILAVSPVVSEKIIIEYFEPYFSDFRGFLIIGRVSHDFLDILNSDDNPDFRASGSCQVDVNCSEGDNWQKEKRSVCRILFDGGYLCSGALINNTNNDGRAYFLTAHHCINNQSSASNTIFYFNYEKPSCNSGKGSLSQSISGSTLRATGKGSDFTLLELSKIPLSTFRPYFAGWDRNNTQNASGVGIHHPTGDVKKISTYTMTPQSTKYLDNVINLDETHWRVIWTQTATNHSVTETGSSGSALFNSNYRIIGQLHGGWADCIEQIINGIRYGKNEPDWYGKLHSSWNLGTTSSERLRDWLDPDATGTFVLDGIDACSTGIVVNLNLNDIVSSGTTTYQATNNIESTSIIQSGATVIYNAGNAITLKPEFHAQSGSQLQAKIQNFNCVAVPNPINLMAWTSVACIGNGLHFNIMNATNYTVNIYSTGGSLIYGGKGNISSNVVTVWSATGVTPGYYIANIMFSSSFSGEEISNTYTISVADCTKNALIFTVENTEKSPSIQESNSDKLDFIVLPNPNNGIFTLQLIEAKDIKPYSVQIFNSLGSLISKIEHCNTNQLNFNHAGLSSGVYYVKLSMGINIVTKKVIIQ